MEKPQKLLAYLSIGLLVIILVFATSSTLKAENLTVTLNAGEYQIIDRDNGQQMIKMEDFGNLLVPGKPMLPAKGFMIALPPGAEVSSVTTIRTSPVEIQGTYKIKPAPPFLPSNHRKDTVKKCLQEWQRNYDATYSSDQIYPQDVGKYLGAGGLRKYTFARVAYFPFSYRPKSGRLTFNPSLIVSIDYNLPPSGSKEVGRLLSDTMADDQASRLFVNYSQARSWYPPEKEKRSPKQSYDYVIVTTEALQDAVDPLVSWKQAIGYGVNVVTTSWIDNNYSGADLQEKIRNFLIDKYPQSQWGIEYVLLVGDIGDVPMRYCYPYPYDHDPSSDWCTPTDYYYADLTGDWDSDGDGYYGEYDEDNVDFVAEVYVGRIPWSNATTVTSICQKLVNFESDNSSWKSNALLLGAMSNYANEDFSGWDRTDGADLMEEMISDMLSGWSYTTMYEKEGLNPCPYDCDYPITHINVVNNWSSNDYGIVNWWAHGGQTGAWRKWWAWDDGDGVPETESPDEISWQAFISNSDVSSLDDDHPSLIFSCSCNNGWPEVSNLGKELLKYGSSGIVASTRISWYTVGWLDETWGGNASIDYYFFHYLINADEKVGNALFDSKVYYLNNFFWWEEASQQNMFDFCLYGDPALERGGVPSAGLFIRGDANCDGRVDISDVVYNLNAYFGSLPPPSCMDAADANDDGQWTIGDGFILYDSQFRDYPPLPPPYPYPGPDPTEDELTCPGGCPYPPDTTVSPSDTFMIVDTQRLQGDSTSSFIILGTSHLNNAGYSIGFCFNPSQLRVDSVDILFDYSEELDNALWNNDEGWCKIGAFAFWGIYDYTPPFTHKPLATVYITISPNVAMEETLWLNLKNGCGGVDNLFSDEVGNPSLATLIDGRILPPHFAFQTEPAFPLAMAERETLTIIVTANDFLSQNFTLNVKAHPPDFISWSGPVFSATGTAVGTLAVTPQKGDKGMYYPSFYLSDTLGSIILGPYKLDIWPCGQTPLSGELSGVLSKEDSPYRVIGDIIVPTGDSLIIEPGVEIKFSWFNSPEKHCFKIRGILKALGTETNPITFTSNQFIPRTGDWKSIEFDSADASTKLSHCRIEYAEKGLYCKYSSPHIEKNLIEGNLYGIYCDHSTPLILNNKIFRNIYGIYCSSSSPLIRENEITQNSNPGITCTGELSSPLIEHNEIISNGSNFFLNRGEIECKYKSSPIVQGNLIQGKLGISGTESCSPLIYDNLICVKECGVSFSQWSGESMISNIVNNTIIGKGRAFIGISCGQGVYSIANNIITGYQAGIDQRESSLRINHNDVWGNETNFTNCPPGVGDTSWGENPNGTPCDSFYNIIQDPLFCNPDSGDYQLAENSPCVGAGQDSLGNPVDIGAFPVGCPPIGIEREKLTKCSIS